MNLELYTCRKCGVLTTERRNVCPACSHSVDNGNALRRVLPDELDF